MVIKVGANKLGDNFLMSKKTAVFLVGLFTTISALAADTNIPEPTKTSNTCSPNYEPPIEEVSKAFGHYLAKKLLNQDLSLLNADAVVQGLKEELQGKKAPLSKADYEKALEALQEKTYIALAQSNLKEAEAFLARTAKLPNTHVLASGKVQYVQTKKGSGKVLKAHETALVRCQAKKLDGTPLNIAQNHEPIILHLDEVIPGIRTGMIGMLEGEARTLYIHPEKAYEIEGNNPNALLIFDVELLETQVSYQEASLIPVNNAQIAHE